MCQADESPLEEQKKKKKTRRPEREKKLHGKYTVVVPAPPAPRAY